ncbi:Glucan 1,3-beta-glucosidase [Smittium culicis]|uniref:glucan endo-1,3-beta-D-glucosidase n=1 Tax=Smittium culicis TaxID=133412 RepID=A0A1R1XQL2_9FUNG|nr:Glucan 1,3-beta-glucosidase [Smittium culicis]
MKLSILSVLIATVSAAGRLNGINYNPKRADGTCGNVDNIKQDLQVLGAFTDTLRIYSAIDCAQGEAVLRAMEGTSWKLHFGTWVDSNDATYEAEKAEIKRLSTVFNFNNNVKSVIVGSEPVYRREQTTAQVADKVKQMKAVLQSAGLASMPVTAADTYNVIDANIVNAVDFVMLHAFPYWEGVSIESATDKMFEHVNQITSIANGKTVMVGETGWPSAGTNFGAAVANVNNAQQYIQEFTCRASSSNLDYIWFSAIDASYLNSSGSANVEASWGVIGSDYKTPKFFNGAWFTCGAAPISPSSSSPVSSAPATSAPATSAPATSAPATSAPATSAPATSAPATSAPATSAPATSAPATSAPATSAPVITTNTSVYNSPAPTTASRSKRRKCIS